MKTLALLLTFLAGPAHSAWTWNEPLTVNSVQSAAIFPHLESANRQGVAVSGGTVGVVWEDNRTGSPQCYLASKPANATAFLPETRLSQTECFEPVLVAVGAGRFVAAWEEAGSVHMQVHPGGAAIKLSQAESAQVSLAFGSGRLYAAWTERAGKFRRIVVASLTLSEESLDVAWRRPVENPLPTDEQSWPALAVAGDGSLTVAWEDRRDHHTVPLVSHSRDGQHFSPPARLTDLQSGSEQGLGAGTGAMRPTLALWGEHGVAAVWLDKRDFLSGYDVYAALDKGARQFGRNLKVQDSFGDNMAQWHAQVVGDGRGQLMAVWDDARDGTQDVWLANWNGAGFAENVAVPAAYGPGSQSDPVATFDAAGNVHLVWLDRDADGVTRIRYARGKQP